MHSSELSSEPESVSYSLESAFASVVLVFALLLVLTVVLAVAVAVGVRLAMPAELDGPLLPVAPSFALLVIASTLTTLTTLALDRGVSANLLLLRGADHVVAGDGADESFDFRPISSSAFHASSENRIAFRSRLKIRTAQHLSSYPFSIPSHATRYVPCLLAYGR